MLPYSKQYFEELIQTGSIREVRPSFVWYEERGNFSTEQIGILPKQHINQGFELLQGKSVFSGEILGGCIDALYDIFSNDRYADTASQCSTYELFPPLAEWKGKILLLETSQERPDPQRYREMLLALKRFGIFEVISGLLIGKPMNERYASEYKKLLPEVIENPHLPILWNVNVGHALPRCIIPFGIPAVVDAREQVIRFKNVQGDKDNLEILT